MRFPSPTILIVLSILGMQPHAGFAFVVKPNRMHLPTSLSRQLGPTGWNKPPQRRLPQRLSATADNDDEDVVEPLADGIDSVSWLPSVAGEKDAVGEAPPDDKTQLLPLFPLGGIVYTPNSEHVLNIFEPRYRQMYNDILMNGTKRFVVSMSHPANEGSFAKMGVLFELEDLKEVSEQTGDQIKYICNHKVTGRVRLHRIVNPEAWESRETYLRVEGTVLDDSGDGDNEGSTEESPGDDVYGTIAAAIPGDPKEESALRKAFSNLVDIQHELEEDVRFTRASVPTLAVKPGAGQDGLWQTIRLWQNFADQRLMARQNELQKDFQDKLLEFLKKERGLKDNDLPSVIGFEDLSPALQKEVQDLQKRMAVELKPLMLESTLTMQKILEARDHTERLQLVRYFVQAECKRLETKRSLRDMFISASPDVPPEEQIDEDKIESSPSSKEESARKSSAPSSLFTDEPDAFQ